MKFTVVNYHRSDGMRSAIVAEGTARLHIITLEDAGLSVRVADKTEGRYMRPVELKGKPYPINRAVRLYRQHARAGAKYRAINKTALKLLKAAEEAARAEERSYSNYRTPCCDVVVDSEALRCPVCAEGLQ